MAATDMAYLSNPALNDVSVEALFGEDVGMNLPMAPQPPTRELRQRIDDLRRRACRQTVAWSKSGTVASITPDGRHVEFRFLRSDPEDGSWSLSAPTVCDLVAGSDNVPLAHLAWAATSNPEIAIFDAAGRVTTLVFSMAVNRPYYVRKWDADPVDDLNAVVGCHWLNLVPPGRQYNVIHGPAVREGAKFKYESNFMHNFGPFHPNPSKSALLCVTTNGLLRLYWTQNTNRVEETQLELENIGISDDLLTHASICSDKHCIYLGLATASKQLRVVKLSIDWGMLQGEKQPPATVPLSPVLVTHHIASTSWYQADEVGSNIWPEMTQLSHLEICPSILDQTGRAWAPPLILAVRCYIPSAESPYQEVQSVLDRWEVRTDQTQSIHQAFAALGVQEPGQDPHPTTRLQKGEPILFNKIIIGLQQVQFGKIIAIFFADGTVEYRERLTMDEMYNEENLERVSSLHQVGFTFADPTPCLETTFSPTGCSLIQVALDGSLKWKPLQHMQGIPEDAQDSLYSAVVAGLTIATSSAIFYSTNFDDVMAISRGFMDRARFTYDLATEIVSMLKIAVDYSEEAHHDNLVRNAPLQMLFSIINHLGFHGQYKARSFCGKFSWLALNARNIIILVTIASNTPINIREKLSPLDEPEVVDALSGCARWSIDLLAWLVDSLFGLLDDAQFTNYVRDQSKFHLLSQYLQAKNHPALHLLMCSTTRGLIVAVCRRLQHLEALGNRAIDFWENKALPGHPDPKSLNLGLYRAYLRMQKITSSSKVKVQEFEKLLSNLGQDIRQMYNLSLVGMVTSAMKQPPPQPGAALSKEVESHLKGAQLHCETTMLLGGPINKMYRAVIVQLFGGHLAVFRPTVDQSALFFNDNSLLEVAWDSPATLAQRRARGAYVDVFRKEELRGGPRRVPDTGSVAAGASSENGGGAAANRGQGGTVLTGHWRRCTRCSAVMEDCAGFRPGFTFVLSQQRRCACGGTWAWLPKGKTML